MFLCIKKSRNYFHKISVHAYGLSMLLTMTSVDLKGLLEFQTQCSLNNEAIRGVMSVYYLHSLVMGTSTRRELNVLVNLY